MTINSLSLINVGKKLASTANISDKFLFLQFKNSGYNLDISEHYQWHLNFPLYVAIGYTPIKLEDYHYFSENSQFGQNVRQVKGGSIRAFQENLQQLIQLIKVHLIPLLKEVKETHFYKKWFDKIVKNDKIVQELLSKGINSDDPELKKARSERNEAIGAIKDKWVGEVDGGKMWTMNKSATEGGLDFSLLPQLFFGIELDNPLVEYHGKGKSLDDQLKGDIYTVDITQTAKDAVARFMFRFYTWLPTAIKDADITFKLKVTTLKQFYSQLQMYVGFMKPLLIEISKKSEGFNQDSLYKDFENENPDFVNMTETSYSFVKVLGIRGFQRSKYSIKDLEFTNKGLFIRNGEILLKKFKNKSGFITGEKIVNKKIFYKFVESEKKVTRTKFKELSKKEELILKEEFKTFGIMEFNFSQKRRIENEDTPQGPKQNPYMMNKIEYNGYVWTLFEIAAYREKLKKDNLDLLESFISEINVIKEDLLYYVDDLNTTLEEEVIEKEEEVSEKERNDYTFLIGPFKGLAEMFSPLLPRFNFEGFKKENKTEVSHSSQEFHDLIKRQIMEETWKMYTLFKTIHGFIQY